MAEHFRGSGHVLRFIEFMDVGTTNGWRLDDVVAGRRDRLQRIGARAGRWSRCAPNYPGEVATRYRYADGGGEIGVIASVTRPFCGGCTRARLSAEGELYTCLFAAARHRPARAAARGRRRRPTCGAAGRHLAARARPLLGAAKRRHAHGRKRVEMSHIGG